MKTVGLSHAKHLKETLETYYEVTADWKGELYAGITLDWDYVNKTVDLSMPKYIAKALHKFAHPAPSSPQHAPYKAPTIVYGAKTQRPVEDDTSPTLPEERITRIRNIVGTLLYYGRAVDPTLSAALSAIASR